MIAALYVERNGVYWNLPDVDPWDVARVMAACRDLVGTAVSERYGGGEA